MKYLLLIFALSLSSCLKDETISGQTDTTDIWHLTGMNGITPDGEITLTFPEKGKIAGIAPCNQYFATQNAVLPWFETGPIGATRRACPLLDLENRYFKTLSEMSLIERAGNTLLLTNDSGGSLEFKLK